MKVTLELGADELKEIIVECLKSRGYKPCSDIEFQTHKVYSGHPCDQGTTKFKGIRVEVNNA